MAPQLVSGTATSTAGDGSSVNSLTVNYPSGSTSGAFLLFFLYTAANQGNTSAHQVPSGWTGAMVDDAPNGSSGTQHYSLFWRFRGAETSVNATWTGQAGTGTGSIIAYQPDSVDNTDPIDVIGSRFYSTSASTEHTAPSITTIIDDSMVVTYVAGLRTSSSSYTHTWSSPSTELLEIHNPSVSGQSIAHSAGQDVVATAGVAGTRTATASASIAGRYARSFVLSPPTEADVFGTDTATGTDTAATTAQLPVTDTATAIGETANISSTASVTDTATGTDQPAAVALYPDDPTTVVDDAEADTEAAPAADTLTFTETSAGLLRTVDDTATGIDTADRLIFVPVAESIFTVDAATPPSVTAVVTDTVTSTEFGALRKQATDTATATETAQIRKLDSGGHVIHTRRHIVPVEPRVFRPKPEGSHRVPVELRVYRPKPEGSHRVPVELRVYRIRS